MKHIWHNDDQEEKKQGRLDSNPRLALGLTLAKLAICLVLAVVAFFYYNGVEMLICQVVEVLVIFLLSEALLTHSRLLGRVVNDVLIILYVIQVFVLIFGNTYLSAIMVDNLGSLEDLSGKAVQYVSAVVAVFVVGLIPISEIPFKKVKVSELLSGALVVELAVVLALGNSYSPIFAYVLLAQHYVRQSENSYDGASVVGEFYNDGIQQYRDKPDSLPDQPNVILIFTEGLSQSIVEDGRGVMSNVAAWEGKSINFSNYYNHTFATYHGISGQLYSGWTRGNLDKNNLVSIQSILSDEGYDTTFVNAEPYNSKFCIYLENLGFDQVVTDEAAAASTDWYSVKSISDKEIYKLLQSTVTKQQGEGEPFFTCVYTFGTHASFDSPDEVFGDGSDSELNKFYNADHWFGEFMDWFDQSELAEDTIVIFTADHATYNDFYFSQAFPDTVRVNGGCDTIPLFIYYKGVEAQNIDVTGRNSVDLAPTILDFLDVSQTNYFLGESLFRSDGGESVYATYYSDSMSIASTQGNVITNLSEDDAPQFMEELDRYYAAAATGAGDS